MTHDGLCDICGTRSIVRPAVVAWRSLAFGRYEAVDRCDDLEACKARVRAAGDPYPVMEPGERVKEAS